MKTLVISGINLFEGGPLSIYYDCLDALISEGYTEKYQVVAFVHKKDLFYRYLEKINFIELPKSRNNYFNRLYYEFIYFYRYSCNHHVDVWFSIHDITPRVKANRIFTYCHNATPFLETSVSMIKYSWKVVAFSCFYKYLYRINIKSADAVIVQQDWMRQEFLKLYPVNKVIVAYANKFEDNHVSDSGDVCETPMFIYAAYPRFFKNFEIILKACEELEKDGNVKYKVCITVDGTENRYSSELRNKYKKLKNVEWLGIVSREKLRDIYQKADAMIFPSKIESWGLPISEFKLTGKPLFLANLPYAHEAIGEYDDVCFFEVNDYVNLSKLMLDYINGTIRYTHHDRVVVDEPFASNWNDLLDMMLS